MVFADSVAMYSRKQCSCGLAWPSYTQVDALPKCNAFKTGVSDKEGRSKGSHLGVQKSESQTVPDLHTAYSILIDLYLYLYIFMYIYIYIY